MITVFLKGLLFGLTLQLSVGPVFFAVLHKSIKEGFRESFRMVLGVTLIDAFYIAVSFTGISGLLQIAWFKKIIFWGGALVLIAFGLTYFKNSPQKANDPASGPSLLYGMKLTLTNPLTIVFWAGTFGALLSSNQLKGIDHLLIYSAGCVAATVLFLGVASWFGKYFSGFLNEKVLRLLDYGVGTFLVLFGLSMFLK